MFMYRSLKKIVWTVLEIFTSGFISGLPYPTFHFSIFFKTWKYYPYTYLVLCIKFGVSIFISFGDIMPNIPPHCCTHTHTDYFKISKHINKWKHFIWKILTEYNIFFTQRYFSSGSKKKQGIYIVLHHANTI